MTIRPTRNIFKPLIALLISSCLLSSVFVPAFSQRRNQQNVRQQRGNRESKGDLAQRIDKLVQNKVSELNVPGYSLVVIYKGNTILQKGYGFADRERHIPVTPETVFGLASMTKTFTALALLILVDEGKVRLDDTLNKYFDGLSPKYRQITIRQLASMIAGVPVKGIGDREGLSWQEEFKRVQNMPLDSRPGTRYSYSNLSYRI